MRVEVVYCAAPHEADLSTLELAEGASVAQALQASGVLQRHGLAARLAEGQLSVGVWGRVQTLDAPLRDRDRVELYRPLLVDPKEARRLRYKRSKAASAAAGEKPAA